jgi:hypothetical protein
VLEDLGQPAAWITKWTAPEGALFIASLATNLALWKAGAPAVSRGTDDPSKTVYAPVSGLTV